MFTNGRNPIKTIIIYFIFIIYYYIIIIIFRLCFVVDRNLRLGFFIALLRYL